VFRHFTGKTAWRQLTFGGVILMITIRQSGSTSAQELKPMAKPNVPVGTASLEPLAPVASLRRATVFLDETALNWTEQHRCGSCHTNYPYLVARPTLKEPESAESIAVRRFFEDRVAHWDDATKASKPKWDAEVITTAWALALNDALTTGKLHPLTRKALDRVWTLQKPNGGFEWLKCGWPPLEHDDYYGALVAALGAGHAPEDYARAPAAKAGIDRLRAYFATNPPPNLHHETMLLWASTRLGGLVTSPQRDEGIAKLHKLQRPDGGWNLPSLGAWKRRDGSTNDFQAPSDGYATGLVVFVLRQAGVPSSDPALRRGVGWLLANQRASGRWFTRSLNNDKEHYIARAGTALAVLALRACDRPDDESLFHPGCCASPAVKNANGVVRLGPD
jgi:squalene-hopene/tetraprenyl-beta-curcumene cyclase